MKAIVIAGRLSKDAVLRRDQSGNPILGFSVAVDDGYGQNKTTMWFDCSVFGKRAEKLEPILTKGTQVSVSGDLGQREYNGKTYLTVSVNGVTLQGGGERKQSEQKREVRNSPSFHDDMTDDIPFAPQWQ